MWIYETGRGGLWTGQSRELDAGAPRPPGWHFGPLPELSHGQGARWTGTQWVASDAELSLAIPPVTPEQVNAERDRRLQADFEFNGVLFQRDTISLQRITGAATLAGFAIANGAQAGDLRWANPDRDFGWIASDNTVVPMDAQTCFAFGQVAANVETTLVFKAKTLRQMDPIPDDYTDDKYWS